MVCAKISRVVLIVINGAFLVASLAMFALGIAMVVDPQGLISFANSFGLDFSVISEVTDQQFDSIIKAGGYFMIALGVIVAIISGVGFCGTCCKSTCLLVVYSVFIVIIIAAQIALIVFVVLFPSTLTEKGEEIMQATLVKSFQSDVQINNGTFFNESLSAADVAWMIVQVKVKCCGGANIADYKIDSFSWKRCGTRQCDSGIAPISCCKLNESFTGELPTRITDFENFDGCMTTAGSEYRNEHGCAEVIIDMATDTFKKSSAVAIAIAAIIIAIELILIIMSCLVIREKKTKCQGRYRITGRPNMVGRN